MRIIPYVVTGLFLEIILLCLVASFRFVNMASTATLLIFNLLFFSLTFQLHGTLNRKLGMLALGNVIGLFWNFTFSYFVAAATVSFGSIFNALYIIFYPLLNSLWVVSFWSLSLTVLHNPESPCMERQF